MRYPNLRYGNPAEFQHYAMPYTLNQLSRILRRDERTVRDWLSARTRLPWWVPEIMRLKHMEATSINRQMNLTPMRAKLGIVTGEVIKLAPVAQTKTPQITDLRRHDFEPIVSAG